MAASELQGLKAGSAEELEASLREIGTRKFAIIGVGNELRGDDFAGSLVIRELMTRLPKTARGTLLIDAEAAPENFTEEIRAFEPEALVFVDSAMMGCQPGTVKLTPLAETKYSYFSTHNVPLKLLSNAAMGNAGGSFLLGIEPKSAEFGEKMSEEVRRSCISLVKMICRIVTKREERSCA